jgi:hypothetical protein
MVVIKKNSVESQLHVSFHYTCTIAQHSKSNFCGMAFG